MHKDDPISPFSISSIKQEEENIIRCAEEGKNDDEAFKNTQTFIQSICCTFFTCRHTSMIKVLTTKGSGKL